MIELQAEGEMKRSTILERIARQRQEVQVGVGMGQHRPDSLNYGIHHGPFTNMYVFVLSSNIDAVDWGIVAVIFPCCVVLFKNT